MTPSLQKNMIGGGVLAVFGVLYSAYAVMELSLGTFSDMGPGMFPFLVGCIVAVIGALISVPAWLEARSSRAAEEYPSEAWGTLALRPLLFVLVAMGAFAFLLERLGLAVAITVLVSIAALSTSRLGVVSVVVISAVLSISSYLIFVVALRMPLDIFAWSF